jgi:hypothetical protein
MKKKNFKLRYQELPALGVFLESSFLRDKELFAAFSPVYANGFAEEYHTKLSAVKAVVNSRVITGKRQMITEKLHATQDALKLMTADIRMYCKMAGDRLTFPLSNLDLVKFRKSLRSRNSEASMEHALRIQQTVAPDLAVLAEMGFTAERQAELQTLIDSLENLNLQQNDLLNERKKQVEEKTNLLNDFWKMIKELMETGQIIHRDTPARMDEYSEKNLITRVRLVINPKPDEQSEKPPAEDKPAEAAITEESVAKEETVTS